MIYFAFGGISYGRGEPRDRRALAVGYRRYCTDCQASPLWKQNGTIRHRHLNQDLDPDLDPANKTMISKLPLKNSDE